MNKKNILLMIIISIFILLILLIMLLVAYVEKKENFQQELDINKQLTQESLDQYSEGKIFPRKLSTLYGKYKGNNSKNDLYESIYNLVEYLPILYSQIKDIDDIKNYYDNNSFEIKKYLGIVKIEDFEKFIEHIKKINFEQIIFNSCEIDDSTYEQNGDYLTFNLKMVYDGLNENITLKVYFSTSTLKTPEFKYQFIEY